MVRKFSHLRFRALFAPDEGGGDGGKPPAGDGGKPPEGGGGDTGNADPPDLGDAGKKALDAERSARRAAEARIKELEPFAAKVKELEDASKSELEKLTEDRDGHKSRADLAESTRLRLEVALDKAPEGMSIARVRAIAKRLQGSTREELEADAEELIAELGDSKGGKPPPPKGTPKERLRGGSDPDDEDPDAGLNPRELAAKVPRTQRTY